MERGIWGERDGVEEGALEGEVRPGRVNVILSHDGNEVEGSPGTVGRIERRGVCGASVCVGNGRVARVMQRGKGRERERQRERERETWTCKRGQRLFSPGTCLGR